MTTPETLSAILAELREIKAALTAPKPPRVFLPEEVRRALGADRVSLVQDGAMMRLCVWYGPLPGGIQHTESVAYIAFSRNGFTTEEAIEAITRQRPTVPA